MALLCLAGIILCFLVFDFVDSMGNGIVVDWFERNYMMESHPAYAGEGVVVREPYWAGVKSLLLTLMCTATVFVILIVFAASRIYARRKVRENIEAISGEIQAYMKQEEANPELFHKEYAQISAQIISFKAFMQRHEQLLKEETARKNDLITYLAHDLKTPLTSVVGYLSLLDEAPDMPHEQRKKYIGVTLNKALRLEKLIHEFFDITRYNLQYMELEEETIDLCFMMVQMTDEFYPLLKAHGNTVELNIGEDMTIFGDSAKLARVFNNILKNAIAYSYRDTAIEIWAKDTDAEVKIYFRNQGRTIPPLKLNAIFEKFFRVDESRATDTGGAGLGLAIAKQIVAWHGGTITANSEKEETTFCVALPSGR